MFGENLDVPEFQRQSPVTVLSPERMQINAHKCLAPSKPGTLGAT